MAEKADEVVKLTVNLTPEVAQTLRRLADERGTNMTEVLKSAIGTERFISDAERAKGKILVEDKDGKIRQLVFNK
ncbi:MAG TPA: CopG family transcriptional regulator [Polyangia bacterium]|jgi:hypothetical protein